jgi:acyl-CoA synthetase (AMP-forming)/AMP-acid ligase II
MQNALHEIGEAGGTRCLSADASSEVTNIATVLEEQANLRPNAPAIVDAYRGLDRSCSFLELNHTSAQAAALLHQQGLRAGDIVLVFQPISLELYQVLAALFRLGLVAMFVDPSSGRQSLERCLAMHAPKGLIASSKAYLLGLILPTLRRIPVKVCIGFRVPLAIHWDDKKILRPHGKITPLAPDAPALITFTSGSTGQPKAVVRSHGFLLAQHRAINRTLGLRVGDIDLTTLPIMVLANLASGVTSVLSGKDTRQPSANDAEAFIAWLNRCQANTTTARPVVYDRIARYCSDHGIVLTGLRRMAVGGAPVRADLLESLRCLAPQAEIIAVYGATEAEPIAKISLDDITVEDMVLMRRGGGFLVGSPVDDIRVRILPDRWEKPIGPFTPDNFPAGFLRPYRSGEIVVNGPHVTTSYLDGHGEETTKFTVGNAEWHRTGDTGYFDHEGRLWLLGRCAKP